MQHVCVWGCVQVAWRFLDGMQGDGSGKEGGTHTVDNGHRCVHGAPIRSRTHGHSVHAPFIHYAQWLLWMGASPVRLKPVKPGLGKSMQTGRKGPTAYHR